MNKYTETNRKHWDEVVAHPRRQRVLRRGRLSRRPIQAQARRVERGRRRARQDAPAHAVPLRPGHALLGAPRGCGRHGRRLLGAGHRRSASLAAECGIDARFVVSTIDDLPGQLDGQFDVVFTSYGVLCWLPDLARWAQVAAHFVKPGGFFYIAEFHPISMIFDDAPDAEDLRVKYPYFPGEEPAALCRRR